MSALRSSTNTWTPEVAEEIARTFGIGELSAEQWHAVTAYRELAVANGASPSLQEVAAASGLTLRKLTELFFGKVAEILPRLAGTQRPLRVAASRHEITQQRERGHR